MIPNCSFFLLVLPELLQLIWVLALLIYCIVLSNGSHNGDLIPDHSRARTHAHGAHYMTPVLQTESVVRLMVLALACCTWLIMHSHQPYMPAYGLISDNLGRLMSVLLCLSAMAVLSLGTHSLKRFSCYEYVLIIWFSFIGMLCLAKSYSFLALYLSVELQSLSFYMLAAMRSRTEASAEAGLKYFILSAFSSAMLLLGMTLIYAAIGSQNFADLALTIEHFQVINLTDYAYASRLLWVGLGCICISLLFKLGVAPFHAWIADVYEGSHTAITAWFAITAKIAVMTVLIRLCSMQMLVGLLTAVAVISLIVGSLSAMRQVKLKRLIAFSAVANGGWFILALTTGQWQLMVIHLIVYTLLNVNLFSVFLLPLFRTHPNLEYRGRVFKQSANQGEGELFQKGEAPDHGADSSTIKYISDLNQVYKINPSLAVAVTISMFSLAGMPPLAGFYSKYLILSAVTQTEQYIVLVLALGVAVLSAFYYIRVVKTIYFHHNISCSNTSAKPKHSASQNRWFTLHELPTNAYMTAITTGLTLVFFVKPEYFCIWLSLV